jgi:hypothetical protein
MKIAWFAPRAPDPAAAHATGLVAELATRSDLGIFVEGPASAPSGCRIHDLEAVHYRNVLFAYDVVVYLVAGGAPSGKTREAFCEWPGVAIVVDDAAYDSIARDRGLRRTLHERMLAVIVHSPSLAERIRGDDPSALVYVAEPPGGDFKALGGRVIDVCSEVLARGRRWLEPLLETACAEIPSFAPDRDAPWRATVDELSDLVDRPRRSR